MMLNLLLLGMLLVAIAFCENILIGSHMETCVLLCSSLNGRLQKKGIKTILLSGDREEAVATIAKTVGMESESINASLTPQQKSGVIKSLQTAGHRVAMVTFFMNKLIYCTKMLHLLKNPYH